MAAASQAFRDAAPDDAVAIASVAGMVESVDRLLDASPGVAALLADAGLAPALERALAELNTGVGRLETQLDVGELGTDPAVQEGINAAIIRLKDALWAVERDRLRTAAATAGLLGAATGLAAIEAYLSIQQSLSAIDRLEVRGRDSAGLHLLVRDHDLDTNSPRIEALLAGRTDDLLFRSGSVRVLPGGLLSFVYKTAAEIGELGDNTSTLRAEITADDLLREALAGDRAQLVVLGHTRWASVGIISGPNTHPLNSEEVDDLDGPYVVAALNGDVDNFADLSANRGLSIPADIGTDAKVIPTLVSNGLGDGLEPREAFRRTVASFEGSVAIATSSAAEPDGLDLALRGSGQALYVGLAEDCYVVASEPYGLVELTDRYLRMDGETPANEVNPTASRGQIIHLHGSRAGQLDGIERRAYDNTELSVVDEDLTIASITTRDIDRGSFPHYLLKEITEAPVSFRKTLRGKLIERDGRLTVKVGDEALPPPVAAALADASVTKIYVIGQGTAAVAGQSLAEALRRRLAGTAVRAEAIPATELSGFGLAPDMSDTLVVAISQSGTTTDTNRTVDLIRARGGRVLAIVNRRGSDLTDKADGVLYTSDGRDVEMSVASTKAFYAQIAAGFLLAEALAAHVPGVQSPDDDQRLLEALRDLPTAMTAVIGTRDTIAEVATRFAPGRRYWALVGNGTNLIAARELRIKLSELCYKSIAHDVTEDKKHIDLSCEPLIIVCAAGLEGSTADDVAKEVAIFRAHKATPIVIATEGQERFGAALAALTVPETHSQLAFVLSAMVGHIFGYEAALAIDAQATPLRRARASIETALAAGVSTGDELVSAITPELAPAAQLFNDGIRAGAYNGHLEAATAVRIVGLFRYALGVSPLESYQLEYGKVGTPAVVIDDLVSALTLGIEELTRPVDAIKHQAKTVTVGISRTDETVLQVPLVAELLAAGAPRDRLSYRTLRTVAALDPAIGSVTGFTRYRVDGETSVVVDRDGLSLSLTSRTDRNPQLTGTKHRVATEQEPLVGVGRSDGRVWLMVPEVKDTQTTGITLLHINLAAQLDPAVARGVLQGYQNRYTRLRDAVTETEPSFRDDLLASVPVVDLLVVAEVDLADRWRT
ncbi:MAG: SIS domain-containing protein [Actinomycetia bacterium]|nr:SIS domain-containing protein [Actinomycetes bacterium]